MTGFRGFREFRFLVRPLSTCNAVSMVLLTVRTHGLTTHAKMLFMRCCKVTRSY